MRRNGAKTVLLFLPAAGAFALLSIRSADASAAARAGLYRKIPIPALSLKRSAGLFINQIAGRPVNKQCQYFRNLTGSGPNPRAID